LNTADEIPDDLRRIMESFVDYAKVMDARFEATQAQYAALMTNMEIIKQQMQNTQDILMMRSKLNVVVKDAPPTPTDKALAEINTTLKSIEASLIAMEGH
jgi:phage-related minor tail protein